MSGYQKVTFQRLFTGLAVVLLLTPFITVFSEQLTTFLQKTPLYKLIQDFIVPYEVRIVVALLHILNIPVGSSGGSTLSVNGQPLGVTWNCLGWQSMFFLIVTFSSGLQGKFTRSSKIEAIIIGVLGTFWVNIFRIMFLSLLGGYVPSIFAVVFHSYFAAFITLLWLIFFWWFSYSFVLEERR